jgi:hypothetical protein
MSALSAGLVIIAVACLLIMALLIMAAGRYRREIRSSIFPIVREESAARVQRARVGATAAAIVAAVAAVAAVAFFASQESPMPALQVRLPALPRLLPELPQLVQAPSPTPTPEPEPTVAPSPSPTAEPTATWTPIPTATVSTPEATATATATATPTRTPIPAHTPTLAATAPPSPTVATLTPEPAATLLAFASPTRRPTPVPLPPDARLGPLSFSLELNADNNAVNPTQVFSNTAARIYAVFPFHGMRKGLLWTRVWYFNNMEFARAEEFWQWGENARSYTYIKPVGAGEYRLELLVNDKLLASGKFTVIGPTAIGGPETP